VHNVDGAATFLKWEMSLFVWGLSWML